MEKKIQEMTNREFELSKQLMDIQQTNIASQSIASILKAKIEECN